MTLSWQAVVVEAAPEWVNPFEWLRSALATLGEKFGSWRNDDNDDNDVFGCADPQLVAALEFIASLIPDEESSNR